MEIIRGDDKAYKFKRINDSGEVITTTPDEIYFTVKTSPYSTEVLIQKTLSSEEITYNETTKYYSFIIEGADTENLNYGTYSWDIAIIDSGYKKTVKRGELLIDKHITFNESEGE